jgi:hypothetical protein
MNTEDFIRAIHPRNPKYSREIYEWFVAACNDEFSKTGENPEIGFHKIGSSIKLVAKKVKNNVKKPNTYVDSSTNNYVDSSTNNYDTDILCSVTAVNVINGYSEYTGVNNHYESYELDPIIDGKQAYIRQGSCLFRPHYIYDDKSTCDDCGYNSYEIIVTAAMRYSNGFIVTGVRHFDNIMHDSLEMLDKLDDKSVLSSFGKLDSWGQPEQGFVTSLGNFVNRQDAYVIAYQHGQLRNKDVGGMYNNGGTLFSECLY